MSHFTVLVKVTKSQLDNYDGDLHAAVENLLAPYQENDGDTCPRQFMEFKDEESQMLDEYENKSCKRVKFDGKTYRRFNDQFFVEKKNHKGVTKKVFELPEGAEMIEVPYKELYDTFDEFVKSRHGYADRDPEMNRYGYWENPNKKWDWWVIGGRWHDLLPTKTGGDVDHCLVSELNIESMNSEVDATIDKWWQKYQKYLQVKRGELDRKDLETEDMFAIGYDIPHTLQSLGIIRCIKPREKIIGEDGEPQLDEDGHIKWTEGEWEEDEIELGYMRTYHRHHWEFGTYAVLDSTGWHQKGEMGWFGVSDETVDDAREWNRSFMECHILNEDPDTTLVIVDCHI